MRAASFFSPTDTHTHNREFCFRPRNYLSGDARHAFSAYKRHFLPEPVAKAPEICISDRHYHLDFRNANSVIEQAALSSGVLQCLGFSNYLRLHRYRAVDTSALSRYQPETLSQTFSSTTDRSRVFPRAHFTKRPRGYALISAFGIPVARKSADLSAPAAVTFPR